MRTRLAILIGLVIGLMAVSVSSVSAETPTGSTAERSPAGKVLPLKGPAGAKPCAAYGPGFVWVEGSGTCVKFGGAIDVGVGVSSRR